MKEHTQKMGRKETDLVMGTKTVVKLETMNIPIKRKRHGSSGFSNKRIKLLDGETELSVDQALKKYDRIVEQKSVTDIVKASHKPSRPRVLSEGSEFSDELSEESELESNAEEEGKFTS